MNTLPAVPDTPTAGEVTGRVEMVDGQLVIRLQPTQVRDVTTRPVHRPEPIRRSTYSGHDRVGDSYYHISHRATMTSEERTEHRTAMARFMAPPWWSPLAWRPVHRRARADLLQRPARSPVLRELETISKEVVTT